MLVTSHKALCVVTRCATVDDFVDTFRVFCDGTSLFVATRAQRPVGLSTPFSFLLADRTPVLSGVGVVRDVWTTEDNAYRRPGLRLELTRLTPECVAVHDRLRPGASPATSSSDAPTVPRGSGARASSPRLSTNPGATSPSTATSARASTSATAATSPRASTSSGFATMPRPSTNPGYAANPRGAASPASPATSPRASSPSFNLADATPPTGTPKISYDARDASPFANPTTGASPLFDDLDLFDKTAPIALLSDDGSLPLVDTWLAPQPRASTAPPAAAEPSPTIEPLASLEPEPVAAGAAPPRARTEPHVSFHGSSARLEENTWLPTDADAMRAGDADAPAMRTGTADAAAPRVSTAHSQTLSPTAANVPDPRAEPAGRGAQRRQMLAFGALCALGGAALALAVVHVTSGSEEPAAVVTMRPPPRAGDAGARHRSSPARTASTDTRAAAHAPPAAHVTPSAAHVTSTSAAPPAVAATSASAPTASAPIASAPAASAPAAASPTAGSRARCSLSIAATPADSEIRVGGQLLGKTRATFVGDCGAAVVEVSHARYATSTQTVTLDGASQTLAVQLARPMHQVEVVSSPPGAAITIAGHVVGTTPAVVEMKGFSSVDVTLDKPGVGRTTVQHYSKKPVDRLSVALGR